MNDEKRLDVWDALGQSERSKESLLSNFYSNLTEIYEF